MWRDTGQLLNLGGNWKVFSPRPLDRDFWVVFPGILKNNHTVDVLPAVFGDFTTPLLPEMIDNVDHREPDFFVRPFSYVLPNERWYKLFEYMTIGGEAQRQKELKFMMARFICTQWNKRYGESDKRLESFLMLRYTEDIGMPELPLQRQERVEGAQEEMWNQTCS